MKNNDIRIAINLYAKIRRNSLISQSYPVPMKKMPAVLRPVILLLSLTLIVACSGKPRLLKVDTFDADNHIQVIADSLVLDIAGETGVAGQVGKTCEFKDGNSQCIGVKTLIIGKDLLVDKVYPVKPIGTLIIEIGGKSKTLVVAIPFDKGMRTIDPRHFMEFFVDHEPVKRAIERWFLDLYGPDAQLLGWDNEEFARGHVERHLYENLQ